MSNRNRHSTVAPRDKVAGSSLTIEFSWTSRGAIILIGVLIVVLVCGLCFGVFFPELFGGLLFDGAIACAWVGCATLLGAFVLRKIRTDAKPQAAFHFATSAGLGLGVFSLILMGLGIAGLLGRGVVVAIPIVAAIVGLSDRPWRNWKCQPVQRWLEAPAGFGALWLIVTPMLAIALVGTSIMPGVLWRPYDPEPYDVMGYHLQVPREWYEAGRIIPLHHNAFSFFPFNIEMHYLAAMYLRGGPWAGMYLAQIMSLCFMALTLIAIYGAVSGAMRATGDDTDTRNAGRAGTIAGCAAATVPFVVMLGCVCYIEGGLFLYGTLAGGWLLRAMLRDEGRVKSMALAGALAGFACGAKYTAIPMFLFGLPIAMLAAMLLARRPMKRMIVGCIAYGVVGLLVFSPWLIRNYAWAKGNPIFPLGLRVLGAAHFTPDQVERFIRAHRPPAYKASLPKRLESAWPEVLASWQLGYVLVPMTIFACVLAWRRVEGKFLALVVVGITLFWLLFTHQMTRFIVPAVPFAAMAMGFALRTRAMSRVALVYVPLAMMIGLFAYVNPTHPGLFNQFAKGVDLGQKFMFRVADPRDLQLAEFKDVYESNGKVALTGDAQPFYCSLPMTHFRYKTVFDVVVPEGWNVVDGWLGEPVSKLRDDGWWVVINRDAFKWMSGSFYKIGDLPPKYDGPRDQPVVLPPTPKP
jgi:hypothetical protein